MKIPREHHNEPAKSNKCHDSEGVSTEVLAICKHLCGDQFSEYILRTQTRSLGGVAPALRARVARQLFHYKPFSTIKSFAPGKDISSLPSPPPNGNGEVEISKWTISEQRELDYNLKGWARWTVDVEQKFVKSTRCTGTTSNATGVCDFCTALMKDEGFIKSLRRVSVQSLKKFRILTRPIS